MATELNGSMLQPFRTKKGRHIQTTWYLLRKSALREGTNQVTVRFAELAPPEVELRLQNLRISISGWLYCRFKDSVDSSVSAYAFVIHLVLFSLFYALCALGVMHLARRSSVDAYRCFTAVLFPIVSLSLFFILGDLFSHAYVIVVSRSFFVAYVLVCVSSGVVACFLHKHAAGFLSPLHILRHANFLFAVFACLMIFTALLCALDFDRIADRTTLAAYLCLCGYLLVRLPMLRRVPHTGAYRRTSA